MKTVNIGDILIHKHSEATYTVKSIAEDKNNIALEFNNSTDDYRYDTVNGLITDDEWTYIPLQKYSLPDELFTL